MFGAIETAGAIGARLELMAEAQAICLPAIIHAADMAIGWSAFGNYIFAENRFPTVLAHNACACDINDTLLVFNHWLGE